VGVFATGELEPPDVIAEVASHHEACLDEISQIPVNGHALEPLRRERFGDLTMARRHGCLFEVPEDCDARSGSP
jgi:hypothetical protein